MIYLPQNLHRSLPELFLSSAGDFPSEKNAQIAITHHGNNSKIKNYTPSFTNQLNLAVFHLTDVFGFHDKTQEMGVSIFNKNKENQTRANERQKIVDGVIPVTEKSREGSGETG